MNISTLDPEVAVVNEQLKAAPSDCPELSLDVLSMVAGGFDGYNLY